MAQILPERSDWVATASPVLLLRGPVVRGRVVRGQVLRDVRCCALLFPRCD